MKILKRDGSTVQMNKDDLLEKLCFSDCGFVRITSTGRIGFSCGKPYEIRALYSAIKREGFVPGLRLEQTMKYL